MPIGECLVVARSQSVSDKLRGEAVVCRTVNFCEFINIYGFHLHFDHFKILEDNVPELMVEMVNINNVLECCRFPAVHQLSLNPYLPYFYSL